MTSASQGSTRVMRSCRSRALVSRAVYINCMVPILSCTFMLAGASLVGQVAAVGHVARAPLLRGACLVRAASRGGQVAPVGQAAGGSGAAGSSRTAVADGSVVA